tara:strand:+ start:1492 stop:3282 length:1791 start_codon:yes stop_codon:yes gene_type:complete
MLLSALAAFFLLAFGLGVFWRSPNRYDLFFFSYSSMIKSFYIGWFVFLVSYFTSFGQALPILSVLFAGAAVVLLIGRFESGALLAPLIPGGGARKNVLVLALAAVLGVTLVSALRPIGDVFTAWDALASWNRWAVELSMNQYKPLNAAYPVLVPALWSLIYEAQSSSALWFFSRALMSVIPLGVMALVAFAGLRRGVIPLIVLSLPLIFGFVLKDSLYSGYMDQPSALMAAGGLLIAALSLWEKDVAHRNEFLMLGVMSVALAVLTKQHAIFAAFAVCALVAVMAFRRQITFMRASVLAAMFLIPILSFLYIYLQEQDALWGNLQTLNEVSNNKVGGGSKVLSAFRTIGAELPVWLWPILGAGTLLNVAYYRKPQALFALLIAALTIPGFFIYADCCSYSERNGMWILGHLSVSCFVGVSLLMESMDEKKLLPNWLGSDPKSETAAGLVVHMRLVQGCAVIAALVLVLVSNEWPISRLMERQLYQQRERIVPRVQTMVNRNPGLPNSTTTVVSPLQLIRFHPEFAGKYRYCIPMKPSCFKGLAPGKTLYVTANWFENEQSLAHIERLVADGHFKYIDQERGVRVYRVENNIPESTN